MKVVLKQRWLALFCACAIVATLVSLSGCKPEELGAAHPTTPDFYDEEGKPTSASRMWEIPKGQSAEEVAKKSNGCMACHKGIDSPSMHSSSVAIGCTDCHGGDACATTKETAHILPRGHWYQEPDIAKHTIVPGENDGKSDAKPAEPKPHGAAEPNDADKKVSGGNELAEFKPLNVSVRQQEKTAETKDETKPAPVEKKEDDKDPHAGASHDAQPAHGDHGAHGGGHHARADAVTGHGGHGGHGGHHSSAANPRRSGQAWMMESAEFVRFVNPGDLRVAKWTCGGCHASQTKTVPTSMMATGTMLWGAALYNNGGHNQKNARFGEAYMLDGEPARLQTIPQPTPEQTRTRGILPFLDPLPRYNITQPGNVLRAFERGGRLKLETALQDRDNEAGKPEFKLSIRGFGTLLSTDPVYLGLQKTRLMDPMLWHLGTSDQAGDYRSSGCTACHTIYANDRDPMHSGPYAKYGHNGQSFSKDEALKDIVGTETGHPIKHVFTNSIPSSQCVTCHMHPGTTVTNTYYGTMWWDNETEGSKMYPKTQLPKKDERTELKIKIRNPEGAALRGLWADVEFLEALYDNNDKFQQVQFADFHGHGWVFRNVYKQDRYGNLLDVNNKIVPFDSANKFKKGPKGEPVEGAALHMQDIHHEMGMHCIDCHFSIDNHGNGKLYGEVRNATEIMCADCHGTIYAKATLVTSGNAAPEGGTKLLDTKVLDGKKRFKWQGDKLIQQSALNPELSWVVKQTIDTIDPGHPSYNEMSRVAKTMRRDAKTWGDVPADPKELAHQDDKMDCYTCHTSWMATCMGCHLPMRANQARFNNHYEGAKSRNWTQYNFQTLREDMFMLGLDGTVKKNKVTPTRSSCAVIVASQNAQREWIYSQQQTISAEGFSGQAFTPHYPHSVRGKETKKCTDCHISAAGDNNAWMANVLMQGTNQTNFMYRYVYVAAEDGGVNAVVVTERDEPQAVIGSTLHRDAYPEEYQAHLENGRELKEYYHHTGEALGVQLRGEYLYTARGGGGLTIYDVANIDNKGFSERIITAPVSPLGQRLYVKSEDCTQVISPTVLGVDPTRQPPLRPRNPDNQEQAISLVYAFLYCTDRQEGLFTVNAATLLDGDPTNNYLRRHMTFNPGGILCGATNGVVAGNYIYITADAGLVIVDISKIGTELAVAATQLNPDGSKVITMKELEKHCATPDPNLLKVVGVIPMNKPKAVRVQFRYAFVVDADGLKVVDITEPTAAVLVKDAFVPFKDAHNVYLARTFAYVAAGHEGMAIVDIEHATQPKVDQMFTANGALCDVRDIKIGMTNNSVYAYVANGHGGLAVVQLTSPETVPNFMGYSVKPKPVLISTKKLHGVSVAISEGLQRDRGVDESGNQLSVFNRVGSRPFNKAEADRMYKIDGKVFTVANTPPQGVEPLKFVRAGAGGVDPALKAKIAELEEQVKKERNPAKKKKLQEELDKAKKEAEEQEKSGGAGGKAEKIKELEEEIKKERNPAKKKKLQAELDALKK
jgi:hypothetical protein